MKMPRSSGAGIVKGVALCLESMLIFALAGCAYALPPVTPPAQVRLRIPVPSPETYDVRLRLGEPHDYRVPADGRITLDVPAYRPWCTVYLLGVVRLPDRHNVYSAKTVDLRAGGKTARQLSLKKIYALPVSGRGRALCFSAEKNKSLHFFGETSERRPWAIKRAPGRFCRAF